MKLRQLKAYMKAAYVFADLSYCKRRKVGCVIVKDDRIISVGYNGTPPGENNCCEHIVSTDTGETVLTTKHNVIHAEQNALNKLDRSPEPITEEVMIFSTTAPCIHCAEKIVDKQIKIVYYDEVYRTSDGVEFLRDHHVEVIQLSPV